MNPFAPSRLRASLDTDGKVPVRQTRSGILVGSTIAGCFVGAVLLRLRDPGDPIGAFTGGIFGGISIVVVVALVLCVGDIIGKRYVAEFNGNDASKADVTNEHGNE